MLTMENLDSIKDPTWSIQENPLEVIEDASGQLSLSDSDFLTKTEKEEDSNLEGTSSLMADLRLNDSAILFKEDSNYDTLSQGLDTRLLNDSNILTREDSQTGKCTYYDAFVCYADEDIDFVISLARFLESDEIGCKIFFRHRDMLAGHLECETSLLVMEERCKRVIVVLSPDFLKCPAYEAQAGFAAVTGLNERYRKLIPIMYKPCEMPRMFKFFTKIDFTQGKWKSGLEKIVASLREGHGPSSFIPSEEEEPPFHNPSRQLRPRMPPTHSPGNIYYAVMTLDEQTYQNGRNVYV